MQHPHPELEYSVSQQVRPAAQPVLVALTQTATDSDLDPRAAQDNDDAITTEIADEKSNARIASGSGAAKGGEGGGRSAATGLGVLCSRKRPVAAPSPLLDGSAFHIIWSQMPALTVCALRLRRSSE